MTDFMLANQGSIFTLTPLTEAAKAWAKEHLFEALTWGGKGEIVIEPRFVRDVVADLSSRRLTL